MSNTTALIQPLDEHALRGDPAPPAEGLRPQATDDLGTSRPSSPVVLRRAIAEAEDFDQLREAARGLSTTAVSLHDSKAGPAQTSAIISNLADSLTRRSIELSIRELGPPPCPFSWVALGSHGRQEAVPGSDVDSALAWDSDEEDEDAKSYTLSLGSRVSEELARCGLVADERGASAGGDLFVRPTNEWRRLIRESISDPEKDKGLIVLSLFLDGRVLHHGGGASALRDEFEAAAGRRGLLRLMLRLALANKPAAGRVRGFAPERSGDHRGRLDIKHGGLLPVTSIARYAALAAGAVDATSTPQRLGAADAAGTLDGDSVQSLSNAFELSQSLRLEHQVDQVKRGIEPDDFLDPKALEPARRRALRDALREVRAVQNKLARGLVTGRALA
ncbi:MAG: putative nucleotidyltransferase substrate binding domain-containing protein [Solirubrobacterales bacterium]